MDADDLFVLPRRIVLLFRRPWCAASEIPIEHDHLYHDTDLLAVQVVQMVFLFAAASESFHINVPGMVYDMTCSDSPITISGVLWVIRQKPANRRVALISPQGIGRNISRGRKGFTFHSHPITYFATCSRPHVSCTTLLETILLRATLSYRTCPAGASRGNAAKAQRQHWHSLIIIDVCDD
jgi:hypothetical protein